MRYWWMCTWTKRTRGSTCSITCGPTVRGWSSALCSRRVTPSPRRRATRWSAPTGPYCASPSVSTNCVSCSSAWRPVERATEAVSGRLHHRASAAPLLLEALSVVRDRLPQPLAEIHDRLVSHELARLVDRRDRVADVTGPALRIPRQHRHAGELPDLLPQVVDAHALTTSDVEHLAGDPCGRRAGGEQVRMHDVGDIHEVAGLAAVTVDGGWLAV